MNTFNNMILVAFLVGSTSCANVDAPSPTPSNGGGSNERVLIISRDEYQNRLEGFWLGQSIANWTGLVTEMDKIGNIGTIKTGDFYTWHDWGKPDQPSIWGQGVPSQLSPTIDFVFVDEGEHWGSDDDTDIEYIYQHLLAHHQTSKLTPQQIRKGWLQHIYSDDQKTPFGKDHEGNWENYLWVSNQRAYDLMRDDALLPPATGRPEHNEHFDMIDAQLTTEIFGLFAPARPDIALEMAHLPVRTTASGEAASIAEFYITMYSLASRVDDSLPKKEQILWMVDQAKARLPAGQYPAAMYSFVKGLYDDGATWEAARDAVYTRYQVDQADGYDVSSRELYCNGCFAAGINFAASLVSLFWGEGDFIKTVKIGSLAGWDSDNPTATWGGMLGFMLGKNGVEDVFGRSFSNTFNIHRTRRGFPNNGIDTFENMASTGVAIVDRTVKEEMNGVVDLESNVWRIPLQ